MNNITKLSLEYLMNPLQYEKYLNNMSLNDIKDSSISNEIQNYKNDILKLTNDLLNNKINGGLNNSFEEYCKICITHIKTEKIVSKLQKEYSNLPTIYEDFQEDTLEDFNLNNIKSNTKETLDNFVIKKNKKKKKKIKFPKKRI